jgi:hypothetical protein
MRKHGGEWEVGTDRLRSAGVLEPVFVLARAGAVGEYYLEDILARALWVGSVVILGGMNMVAFWTS